MPKYLWQVSYTPQGAKGLLDQGGTVRRAAITEMVESVGGSVEACYFSVGADDVVVVGEVPDETAAAALHFRTIASGGSVSRTTPLLTAGQVDDAVQRAVDYKAPGE
jgi:uncharacterized protein with GYD domain